MSLSEIEMDLRNYRSLPSTAAGDSPPAPVPSAAAWSGWDWLFLLAVVALVFLAYQPAWHAGFIWGDDGQVTPPNLRSLHGLGRIWLEPGTTLHYHPLLHSTLWLEHRLFGDDPAGYHLVNIGLHAFNAVLLGLILGRLQVPGAYFAAGLFALHPVMVVR
ncbi:MAG: hypothetical protein EXS39_06975 [Opitutaceae bacterium]|nr:hypothetical protein [Opitutaceae bacterium]